MRCPDEVGDASLPNGGGGGVADSDTFSFPSSPDLFGVPLAAEEDDEAEEEEEGGGGKTAKRLVGGEGTLSVLLSLLLLLLPTL